MSDCTRAMTGCTIALQRQGREMGQTVSKKDRKNEPRPLLDHAYQRPLCPPCPARCSLLAPCRSGST